MLFGSEIFNHTAWALEDNVWERTCQHQNLWQVPLVTALVAFLELALDWPFKRLLENFAEAVDHTTACLVVSTLLLCLAHT